jgi:hypothetical protein
LSGLVFLHTLLIKVVMVVVVGVVAVVVVAVVAVRDAVVMMVGMVMANVKVAVTRRIDIFECWLNVGDIGCNVNSEFCSYFLSPPPPPKAHHHYLP